MKYFVWGTIGLVAVAVISAFFIIGSPAHQRLVMLDQQRVSDLQTIQGEVASYFYAKGTLPTSLAELDNSSLGNFTTPVDPATGGAYSYAATNKTQYQLCADYSLASDQEGVPATDSYQHSAGHSCFYLSINPSLTVPSFQIPTPVTVQPASAS